MTITTLGDLTSQFLLRRQNVALRDEMQRLSLELTSGQTADPIRHLTGDFAALSDIEQRMTGNAAFRQSATEAAATTDAMQTALGNLQDMSSDLAKSLMDLSETGLSETSEVGAVQARDIFNRAVSLLNTRIAGRSLFAGVAVEQSALADAETILSDLRGAVSGLSSLADIRAAVDTWFDTPGGAFDTVAYQGSPSSIPAFRVAQDESVRLDLRADHEALRDTLKHIALAAIADDPAIGLTTRGAIYGDAAVALFSGQDGLSAVRADLGVTQARLEETTVRLASEKLALEQSRGTLLSVDPYETATRLEHVQSSLESLYTVTVRLSRLSLTEFM